MFRLIHQGARNSAIEAIRNAPEGWIVKLQPPKRNLEQSALFHALCAQASRSLDFQGKKRSPDEWKVLFCSGHSAATKQGHEILPGLEGEWCNVRESTATMSKSRMTSLIEYVTAYLVSKNVYVPKTTTAYE